MVQQILYTKSQEIGYTDTIIDVRSNRVRSLLGPQADQVRTLDVLEDVNFIWIVRCNVVKINHLGTC